jgi:hypothetical protein
MTPIEAWCSIGGILGRIFFNAIAQRNSFEGLSNSRFWLRQLPGGLPADFDYGVIRFVADAKALILALPNCDRGRAAVELYRHRNLIGALAAYSGIMVAWDHSHREIIDAFGSVGQFISALRDVAPSLHLGSPKRIEVWRGVVMDRADALRHAIGLSWTRSRNVASWFAFHDHVPELQPSLAPVVLHADLDQSAIVARHDARAEQEVIVDVNQLFLAGAMVRLDGIDNSLAFHTRFADLDPAGTEIDCLIAKWRLASERYEHWKSLMVLRWRLARKFTRDGIASAAVE